MVTALIAMLILTGDCSLHNSLQAELFNIELQENYHDLTSSLAITIPHKACVTIYVIKPDGSQHSLDLSTASVSKSVTDNAKKILLPIQSVLRKETSTLSRSVALFDLSGNYQFVITSNSKKKSSNKPVLYKTNLEWQFPECNFRPNAIEPWKIFLEKFKGKLIKTQLGYEKQIVGKAYQNFTVSLYACAHTGMTIKVKGLNPDHRQSVLKKMAAIIAQINPEYLSLFHPIFMSLGDNTMTLQADGPFFMTIDADVQKSTQGLLDVSLSVHEG